MGSLRFQLGLRAEYVGRDQLAGSPFSNAEAPRAAGLRGHAYWPDSALAMWSE